jgi:hypothetical protein
VSCIRKYHRLHKKRQHEVSEDVRRHCRDMCMLYRKNFFHEVVCLCRLFYDTKQFSGNESLSSPDPKQTESGDGLLAVESSSPTSAFDDENDALSQIIKWATDKNFGETELTDAFIFRRTARQLAAAYYIATYSPFREFHGSFALFSFPWLVADVIACGMHNDATGDVDADE